MGEIKQSSQVIHITRSASKTSMPWNDLHKNLKLKAKIQSSFIVVNSLLSKARLKKDNQGFDYLESGILNMAYTINSFRNERDSILHCHNASLFLPCLFFSLFLRKRVLFNIHNDWLNFNIFQSFNILVVALFRKKIICVSKAVKNSLPQLLRSVNKDITFIDNSIDSSFFNSEFPIEDFKSIREKKIIIIARMVPQKNVKLIIKIIRSLDSTWKVDWFGDGPEKAFIEKNIKDNPMKCQLTLRGIVARKIVFEELSNSLLYLACSTWEGIGVANLEAGALGCIPLLSNIPPHKNIADNTDAILCSLESHHDWIQKIQYFYENPDESRNLAKHISQLTRSSYDKTKMINEYIKTYECF